MPRLSKIGAAALAAFGWTGLSTVTASYLQVAGGGGGGGEDAGGGGAGGYLTGTTSLNPTLSYTVLVGAGGAGGYGTGSSNNGSNTQFGSLTASVGGGGGGSYPGQSANGPGHSGGSGGGGAAASTGNTPGTGGSATSGQGYAGGNGLASSTYYAGGGGGGAGQAGFAGSAGAGNGGVGLANSIIGTSTYYAGGGGGGSAAGPSSGGLGGGGAGYTGGTANSFATSGTANLGGGGGGGGDAATASGGNGGSGVVIISYPSPQKFGGGIVTTSGSNTIHTFQTSGTLSPLSSLTASYLIVAGGGGAGGYYSAGAGAGGMLTGSGLTIDTNSTYLVTVGSGGTGTGYATVGGQGTNSTFSMVTTAAVGGGTSAQSGISSGSALNGGSGGGAIYNATTTYGTGTSGQGNNGGQVTTFSGTAIGAGGGGAGAVGGNAANTTCGAGGNGLTSSISGTSTYYAGGGGGGCEGGGTFGAGGLGGGGAGRGTTGYYANGVSGTANTGGGGGGCGYGTTGGWTGGNGGSGVVIISYAGSTQLMAGGTVTISGGNVIHTFTSSGYLTPLKLVNNSLRFRSSASAYLNRTPATASNRKTWTWSAWVKRGTLSSSFPCLFQGGTTSSDTGSTSISFGSNDRIYVQGYSTNWIITNASYRDPAAWYHIVLAMDSTQATASNRFRLYVNGSEVSYYTYNNLTQNTDYGINQAASHVLGQSIASFGGVYFDGYMSEVNFIDGQQLTPNSFGTFNSYGVWQPITYGGSYGTNGFYLPFTGTNTYNGSFNGTSQYLSVSSFSLNWSTYGNFTIEGYFNITNWSSADPLSIFGTAGAGNTIGYVYANGSIGFGINGVNEFVSATGLVSAGIWYHIAFVRNGTNINIYLNGVSVASTSSASTYLSNTTAAFQIGFTISPYYFKGYISNYRFTNTVVYSSNFVPSTSPLTAITGTQLLTLQNSTIIDNSSNAYTITNTGSVTTSGVNPFSILGNKAIDKSSSGNNWTANNIGVLSGSTNDNMTDVPTLTSTTTANYAVQSPLYPGSSTITNGNLQSTSSTTTIYSSASSFQVNNGKWYWEVTATTINGTNNYPFIGAYRGIPTSLTGAVRPGGDVTGFSYRQNGSAFVDSTNPATWGSIANGDVIGVTLDLTNLQVSFYKNNVLQGTITGLVAGTYTPADSEYNSSSVAYNFGQQPFVYTPPSGFVALNTYNI